MTTFFSGFPCPYIRLCANCFLSLIPCHYDSISYAFTSALPVFLLRATPRRFRPGLYASIVHSLPTFHTSSSEVANTWHTCGTGHVGNKTGSAEVQATFVMMKNLCIPMSKEDTKRERERDRHKETLYFLSDSYKRHQPLLKVTKSLYIVTILGQLPFMLFIEITRTWVVQRDNVNTAIIHSYSTLPHNKHIHGLSETTGIYKVYRTNLFFLVGKI